MRNARPSALPRKWVVGLFHPFVGAAFQVVILSGVSRRDTQSKDLVGVLIAVPDADLCL